MSALICPSSAPYVSPMVLVNASAWSRVIVSEIVQSIGVASGKKKLLDSPHSSEKLNTERSVHVTVRSNGHSELDQLGVRFSTLSVAALVIAVTVMIQIIIAKSIFFIRKVGK